MRDNRYTRGGAPYDEDGQGYMGDFWQPGQADDSRADYGDGQSVGFTRHTSSNARRFATGNPVVGAVKQAGGAVAGLFRNVGAKPVGAGSEGRSARTSASSLQDNGDYLGVGNACRSCGKPVDSTQLRCAHCGAFVRPLYTNVVFLVTVIAFLALVVLLSLAINSCRATQASVDGSGANSDIPETVQPQSKDDLSSLLSSSQGLIDSQAVNRTYTRHSLNNLQYYMDLANEVLIDQAATEEQIAEAIDSVNGARDALVAIVGDYPWPEYADLSLNTASYVGQQVAVNGTVQLVNENADGSLSALIAVAGDANNMVQIDYFSTEAVTPVEVGDDLTGYGTVTGSWNNAPVILADRVEVMGA